MTNEERKKAIDTLKISAPVMAVTQEEFNDYIKTLNKIMNWLEQEPCGDVISRKALISHLENQSREWGEDYDVQQILGDIEDFPSVKPQEPKTVIYSGDGYADGYMVYDMAECPNCGYEYEDNDKDWGLSFCPNCGQALDWERSE